MLNTKLIMTASAIMLGVMGITLTFLPKEIAKYLDLNDASISLIILQLLGATYYAFAMLNWMSKEKIIGGIYNRPIAIGNFTHFFIGGLALIRVAVANQISILWIASILYVLFALFFGLLLFRNPIKPTK